MARPRERVIPRGRTREDRHGPLVLADVYNGPQPARREARRHQKLLILESLPKPVNFSGGPDLSSWLGTFTLERVVGTVPVEADGSAYFEAAGGPAALLRGAGRAGIFRSNGCRASPRHARRDDELRRLPRAPRTQTPPRCPRAERCWPSTRPPAHRAVRGASGRAGFHARHPADPRPALRGVPRLREARRQRDALAGDSGPHWSHSYFSLLRPPPGGGRPQRPGQPAAAHHRQLGQPAAAEGRRQPLRREGDSRGVAHPLAVDRERRALRRHLRRAAQRRAASPGRRRSATAPSGNPHGGTALRRLSHRHRTRLHPTHAPAV